MYTDATTARSENRNISIRNYSTDKYTGNLVHDHETVIYNYGNKHIECNVHVSRYVKGCYENTNHKWPLKMRSFLCSLNEYRKKLKTKNIEKLDSEKLERYSKRYDEILKEGYEENKKIRKKFLRQDEQRLLNRLKKYKENHLLFLYDFTAPFDNNLSERELRHIKTKQKVSGYFNSFSGAQMYSNIKSLIITLKKQGKNFYNEIFNIYEKLHKISKIC